MAELAVEEVTVRFGGVVALDRVTMAVRAGQVTGLIGPNGAGKTTLFDVVNGLRRPESGRVVLDGRDVTRLAPRTRARRGLSRTFQRLELFGTLSATENVQTALEARHRRRGDPRDSRASALGLLERVGLSDVADQPADLLPTGLARLLELARALASEPAVLLLDEPSAGLDPDETAALGRLLEELAGEGLAVLLVEHDMDLVMQLCTEITVLDAGAVIASGDPRTIRAHPAVQDAYLGVASASGAGARGRGPAPPARRDPIEDPYTPMSLELQALRACYGRIEVLHGVDLRVRPGTITALLGPNGAGKSSLLKVASGRLRATGGRVLLDGADVEGQAPERLARLGVCTIPEGRGVFPNLTVAENLRMFAAHSARARVKEVEASSYERFPVLGDRRRQLAGRLSGGEQQMLALARALGVGPRLLLVDELSVGLAPLVVEELYGILAGLSSAEGLTVLLVEQFAHMALSVAAHVAVMVQGKVVTSGPPEVLRGELAAAYLGAVPGPASGPAGGGAS